MKINRLHCAVAALFGVSLAVVTHAASFDLNRLFDAGRGVMTATTDIPEKQEIATGRDVAGTVLGAAPLVNDPALQNYVNRVGRWIASQGERPDLPWRFGVVETAGINAFAAPGGYVLITRGLYEVLENESQLAGVLGHEIAHIIKRHHITVMQSQGWLQAGTSLGQAAVGRRGGVGGAVGEQVAANLGEILTKGLDKGAEFEADHLGVVLAARAGYSPSGLVDVLRKLQSRAGEPSLALLFSTHPHPGERLEKLGEAMKPRMGELPAGMEPAIQAISAGPGSRGRAATAAPAGVRSMQEERREAPPAAAAAPQGGGSGLPVDPAGFLRGLIGR
jgi:predicted Zn-dependent protease